MRAGRRVGQDERVRSGRRMSWYLSRARSTERGRTVSAPGPKIGAADRDGRDRDMLLRTLRSEVRMDVHWRGSRLGGLGPRRARHVEGVWSVASFPPMALVSDFEGCCYTYG